MSGFETASSLVTIGTDFSTTTLAGMAVAGDEFFRAGKASDVVCDLVTGVCDLVTGVCDFITAGEARAGEGRAGEGRAGGEGRAVADEASAAERRVTAVGVFLDEDLAGKTTSAGVTLAGVCDLASAGVTLAGGEMGFGEAITGAGVGSAGGVMGCGGVPTVSPPGIGVSVWN